MEIHNRYSDNQFARKFLNCELDPAEFTHEAHLRLAWLHINKYGIEQAEEHIQVQLQKYVEYAGAQEKYNTTLTLAAIKAVNHFMQKSKSNDFRGFITEFPRLKSHFMDLMKSHYGFDIFNSSKAKSQYLEPDLLPFD